MDVSSARGERAIWVRARPNSSTERSERWKASATKPRISGPIGPVMHNGQPSNSRSPRWPNTLSYTNRYPDFQPVVDNITCGKDENYPPKARPADSTPTQPPRGIPKSRTFSVLSSFTHSFSRGSLGSRANTSRNVSAESSGSHTWTWGQGFARQPLPSVSRESLEDDLDGGKRYEATLTPVPSTLTPVSSNSSIASLPDDPRLVRIAMPPQYWAGRFMALHDQFHNELLEPQNLAQIMGNNGDPTINSSSTNGYEPPSSAASRNNPSTSVYGLPRGIHSINLESKAGHSRHPSRIPQSATSGAILQTSTYSTACTSSPARRFYQPPPYSPRLPSYEKATGTSIRFVPTTTAIPYSTTTADYGPYPSASLPTTRRFIRRRITTDPTTSTITTPLKVPPPLTKKTFSSSFPFPYPYTSYSVTPTGTSTGTLTPTTPLTATTTVTSIPTTVPTTAAVPTTTTAPTTATTTADSTKKNTHANSSVEAKEKDDDDARCRRVYMHLEALCVTDVARASLRAWWVGFVRRTGRGGPVPVSALGQGLGSVSARYSGQGGAGTADVSTAGAGTGRGADVKRNQYKGSGGGTERKGGGGRNERKGEIGNIKPKGEGGAECAKKVAGKDKGREEHSVGGGDGGNRHETRGKALNLMRRLRRSLAGSTHSYSQSHHRRS